MLVCSRSLDMQIEQIMAEVLKLRRMAFQGDTIWRCANSKGFQHPTESAQFGVHPDAWWKWIFQSHHCIFIYSFYWNFIPTFTWPSIAFSLFQCSQDGRHMSHRIGCHDHSSVLCVPTVLNMRLNEDQKTVLNSRLPAAAECPGVVPDAARELTAYRRPERGWHGRKDTRAIRTRWWLS